MFVHKTVREMHEAIKDAIGEARRAARRECKFLTFEGSLVAGDGDGRIGDPEYITGYPSKKAILEFLEENPGAKEIWYSNHIRGADKLEDFECGDYYPGLEYAEVKVWDLEAN